MPSPSVALLRTQSDDRLVSLAASGHERAFEAIVERYRRQLLRHARRYLPDARAEDAVQHALVSAWSALRRGDGVRELRPWLHRIVHNTALNALRTAGYDYEQLRETLVGDGGPAEAAERAAVVRGTLAGLAALPERQRDALLQIAVEGRSQDEVAAELGLTQNAVRQLVHRARTSLRTAATAAIPLPLATWLATAGSGRADLAVRVGELVAGAGASATLAKAGAVAVIAGGAVAGPAVVHDTHDPRSSRAEAAEPRSAPQREADAAAPPATPAPGRRPSTPVVAPLDDEEPREGGRVRTKRERVQERAERRDEAARVRERQHGTPGIDDGHDHDDGWSRERRPDGDGHDDDEEERTSSRSQRRGHDDDEERTSSRSHRRGHDDDDDDSRERSAPDADDHGGWRARRGEDEGDEVREEDEGRAATPSPTPSPSPEPTATSTPAPTMTPSPTPTPAALGVDDEADGDDGDE